MEWYHWTIVGVGLAGFIVQTLVLAITGTWALSKIRSELIEILGDHKSEMEGMHAALQREFDAEKRIIRSEFGETVKALSYKVHEFETWSRDHFLRRDSFIAASTEFRRAEEIRDVKYEKRFDRIDEKLERLIDRGHDSGRD